MSTEKRSSSVTIVFARITEALRDLADVDFQRRVWIEGSKAEVSSPAEVFSALFDDSGLRDALSRKQQVFSAGIDARLAAFDRRLKPIVTRLYFLDLIDLAKEIEGAEWSAVRAEASLLLEDISRSGVI
ncbi:MAG: hypothetical protein MUF80_00710 [Burkholderiales bacterium]|nr:hypothetical protein [Burkholderiales bacterium]